MEAARILKRKIKEETPTIGILLTNHLWPEVIEISINAGLDYLIIDTEHGAFSPELIVDVCAIGRLLNFAVLIRPISHEINTIRKTIDMGACGLLLPTIQSAANLDEVRQGIYMPPRGQRRPGGLGNRWVRNYSYETWKSEVEDDLIVLPQIETRQALGQLDAIGNHEITTAMAIGPYDLSADLGVCAETTGPVVGEAIQQIRLAARKAGKNMWMIGDGPTLARQGFTFICIGEPMWMLQATLRGMVQHVKPIIQGNSGKPEA
jgi:2-keto-3-deoxy-L-rhamnonate aldolase RhmA